MYIRAAAYKKLPTCDTAKIRTAFLILRKKKTTTTITNIFKHVNHVNTDPGVPHTFSRRFFFKTKLPKIH